MCLKICMVNKLYRKRKKRKLKCVFLIMSEFFIFIFLLNVEKKMHKTQQTYLYFCLQN